ncbi:MAG TPA: hypothetical protein VNN73_01260 [Blastocatellia bacterium]|nr:hypothetical protein [Blastocatellia bacterium]
MIRKRILGLFLLSFLTTHALAQDFWNEPFEKWNRGQVLKIINDSPWARSETLTTLLGGRDAGLQGNKEIYNKFTVRFFSALPVREAYVRMMQILNKYDEMNDDQRRDFDSRFKRALNLDVNDRVIISLDFASNDNDTNREMKLFLDTARTDTIKQNVYLISQRLGRIELREYFPPSSDGTGAKFIFPRSVNGKEVVDPADKEVRFEFNFPLIDRNAGGARNMQRLLVNFKVPKMLYRGQLSY